MYRQVFSLIAFAAIAAGSAWPAHAQSCEVSRHIQGWEVEATPAGYVVSKSYGGPRSEGVSIAFNFEWLRRTGAFLATATGSGKNLVFRTSTATYRTGDGQQQGYDFRINFSRIKPALAAAFKSRPVRVSLTGRSGRSVTYVTDGLPEVLRHAESETRLLWSRPSCRAGYSY